MTKQNLDKLRELQRRWDESGRFGDTKFLNLETGTTVLRILPPVGDMETFNVETAYHYYTEPTGDRKGIQCPALAFGEDCPVCAEVSTAYKGSRRAKKVASKFRATTRHYLNVIDRNDIKAGPQVLMCGRQIMQPLVEYILDPDCNDLTDPIKGSDVKIKRTGKGIDTEYTVVVLPKVSPVDKTRSGIKALLSEAADLSKFLAEPDMDALQDVADEVADAVDLAESGKNVDEDEERSSRRRPRRSETKRRPSREQTSKRRTRERRDVEEEPLDDEILEEDDDTSEDALEDMADDELLDDELLEEEPLEEEPLEEEEKPKRRVGKHPTPPARRKAVPKTQDLVDEDAEEIFDDIDKAVKERQKPSPKRKLQPGRRSNG